MNNIYVEALYNENRNAIPSWQGYQYQAQVATYFFLNHVLNEFNENSNNISNVSMKIEWMEDFVIYDNNTIKKIYQVKKTLDSSEYEDVIQNFILQHKIIDVDTCRWIVVYDKIDKINYSTITKEKYEELYDKYIIKLFLNEIEMLIKNCDNPEFWKENLKEKYKESKLLHVRNYINNLLNSYNMSRIKLDKVKCREFVDQYLNILKSKLTKSKDDFSKFKSQVKFENKKIDCLDGDSQNIIEELCSKQFLKKSDIMFAEDIVKSLYTLIYQKLMSVKSKKIDTLEITFNDVKEIFLGRNKAILLWKDQVYKTREDMIKNIQEYCNECTKKACKECIITEFLNLDFCEVIDSSNLEYPKFQPEKITESLRKKLSPEKYNFIIDILFTNKEKISCIEKNNFIELKHNNQKIFVSENIAEDRFNKKNLILNIPEHLDVYMEYSNILTRSFTDTINYNDIKIVKDLEEEKPKFMDIPQIKFKSKQYLEEDKVD